MAKGQVAHLQAKEAQRRLSKEELLKPQIAEEEVHIEALDGTVLIRSLTFAQRRELHESTGVGTEDFSEDEYQLHSIMKSLIDPELSKDDLKALREQDGKIIDELIVAITMLNMVGRAGELKKGSSETQS